MLTAAADSTSLPPWSHACGLLVSQRHGARETASTPVLWVITGTSGSALADVLAPTSCASGVSSRGWTSRPPVAQPAAASARLRGGRVASRASGSTPASCSQSSSPRSVSATRGNTARRRLPPHCGPGFHSATVRRDGQDDRSPAEEIVPGDVVLLSAGSLVPADAVILEATDFFVSEAVLTGESFPSQKTPGVVDAVGRLARAHQLRVSRDQRAQRHGPLPGRHHGSGHRVRRHRAPTDASAAGNRIRSRHPALRLPADDRDADHGHRRLRGHMSCCGRPPVETLLFAVALAVGLSPELLPAILSVNLARGARDDGAARRPRPPAERDREPRQHGCAVHRQDRHAHRGRGAAGRRL